MAEARPPRVRFEFLDGIRGLAALYVVLFHFYLWLGARLEQTSFSSHVLSILRPLSFGRYSVDTFIVLSGFCLMLPIARSADGRLRGGPGGYLLRRAKRIVPPYYASVALSLLFLGIWSRFSTKAMQAATPQYVQESFAPLNIVAHVLLLHNLLKGWSHTVNIALWSVATEWQIYFLFPAVLLPVWRRFGLVASTVIGLVVGWALYNINRDELFTAAPWFVGLFAIGMAGAVITFSTEPRLVAWRERTPWLWLCVVLGGGMVLLGSLSKVSLSDYGPVVDPIFGLVVMALLIGCARLSQQGRTSTLWLRLFDSRPAVVLGGFSYSLYLTHCAMIYLFDVIVDRLHPSPSLLVIVAWPVFISAALGFAYLFHLAFERPFMSGPAAHPEKAPAGAITVP